MGKIGCLLAFWGVCVFSIHAQQDKLYHAAEIKTIETFLYGRFEIRMQSARGNALVTQFYTFYDNSEAEHEWNEIDLEILGKHSHEVQVDIVTGIHDVNIKKVGLHYDNHDNFHTYAIEWTPDYIRFTAEGKEIHRFTGDKVKLMNKPQHLILSLWPCAERGWTGDADGSTAPSHTFVDYIKYDKYTPGVGDGFSPGWMEEFNSLSHDRWLIANHTFDANLATFAGENAVIKRGYLVLCVTKAPITGFTGSIFDNNKATVTKVKGKGNRLEVQLSAAITHDHLRHIKFIMDYALVIHKNLSDDSYSILLDLNVTEVPKNVKLIVIFPGRPPEEYPIVTK